MRKFIMKVVKRGIISNQKQIRKFARAMQHQGSGGNNQADSKWKGLALPKKDSLHIKFTMPKRQFIGKCKELDFKIEHGKTAIICE